MDRARRVAQGRRTRQRASMSRRAGLTSVTIRLRAWSEERLFGGRGPYQRLELFQAGATLAADRTRRVRKCFGVLGLAQRLLNFATS